jgi:RNA polymerase sigma-70 factor (ECF subfamily)
MPLHSAESFSELFNQTHLIVFRYIYGLHGSPQEAVEDLTAETYLRAWRGRARFAGDEQAALRWLLRIARNLVIDSYRREQIRPQTEKTQMPDLPSEKAGPEDQVLIAEQIQLLLKALTRLPAQQREMVVLRFVLGWRVKDIAEHLGLVQNTVSVNLQRTLRRLRQNWPAG